MEYLKADYTEVWISSPVVPLVQFADCVKAISSTQLDLVGVVEFPQKLAQRLREFDEVVSWYGTGRPEFRREMSQVQPRCTFLRALPEDEPAVDFYLRQVGGSAGSVPQIQMAPCECRNTLAIHPFSGSARKNWPLERYLELARRSPWMVEWMAGPEEALAEAKHFENLLDLATWLHGAAVYLGNDSGISHLAAAIGLPVVALFGPTDPAVWSPRGHNRITVLRHRPLSDLSVDLVMKAAASASTTQGIIF